MEDPSCSSKPLVIVRDESWELMSTARPAEVLKADETHHGLPTCELLTALVCQGRLLTTEPPRRRMTFPPHRASDLG
ncbi:hypothetical protein [Streptomyces nigrescens]|uniref:hypothetical protein n=1 Tax=Streptomyces nigrescens TaxID=1920 RepID=UPI0036FEE4D3